ncbi:MAG: hypothetical protein L0Y44_05055 [Phycisphaerales bacterium]|nr:hypothetical protein [Phycisphaerales bacterium]
MTDQPDVIDATRHMDPDGSIVLSARLLGRVVVRKLESSEHVHISFAGMRGLPSSYFNELLQMIVSTLKTKDLCERVKFEFDSPVQVQVFERSLAALRQDAA